MFKIEDLILFLNDEKIVFGFFLSISKALDDIANRDGSVRRVGT